MATPFIGEIRIMSFGMAPEDWALCNGQLLRIDEHQALYGLLKTTFGGDGKVNFALPNFQGRTPIHVGGNFSLGQSGGEPTHTLTHGELPYHTHVLNATNTNGAVANPSNAYLGAVNNMHGAPASLTTMAPASVTNVGGSQAHPNMQPYLTLNFCIALRGIFPSEA